MNNLPAIYLAGPIRDESDYIWRKEFVAEYIGKLQFRIPSDIITADISKANLPEGKLRSFAPSAYMTYRTDLDLIDRSDMVVVNLLPMAEGYPAIGTLIETGYARAKGKLIFIVADAVRKGHPFLAFGADGLYPNFEELGKFLHKYLDILNGGCPVFNKI